MWGFSSNNMLFFYSTMCIVVNEMQLLTLRFYGNYPFKEYPLLERKGSLISFKENAALFVYLIYQRRHPVESIAICIYDI